MYKQNITNLYELLVVVPDEVYEQAKKTIGSHTVKNIDVKDERNSKVLTEKLKESNIGRRCRRKRAIQ